MRALLMQWRGVRSAAATKATILLCGPPVSALGGGPTHMKNLLGSPLQQRYRLVHFETGSRGRESPAKDEPHALALLRLLTSPFVLAWRLLWSRPAVVHLNSALFPKAFWRDLVYLLVSKACGRKVVLQFHGGAMTRIGARALVRRVFALADALVVLGQAAKSEFDAIGISERVVVIPNGIDIAQYRGQAPRLHAGAVRRLAYMGRLDPEKGIFEAIEAVRQLRAEPEFGDVELSIAGSGPARVAIEQGIVDAEVSGAVRLLGPLYGAAKAEFLRAADVLLFPSYHEGLPYAVLESLAAGTPIIASRVGDIPDVVGDGVHGILIEPRDPGEIVRAIRRLRGSPELLQRMSQESGEWAAQELGLDRLAYRFEQLYERLRH